MFKGFIKKEKLSDDDDDDVFTSSSSSSLLTKPLPKKSTKKSLSTMAKTRRQFQLSSKPVIRSLKDSNFDAANEATIHLMQQNHNQSSMSADALDKDDTPNNPMAELHSIRQHHKINEHIQKKQQQETERLKRQREKQKDVVSARKVLLTEDNTVPSRPVAQPFSKKQQEEDTNIPIDQLEHYMVRAEDHALFVAQNKGRPPTSVLVNRPPEAEVLAYAKQQSESERGWFTAMQHYVANHDDIDFPDVRVLSRVVLVQSLCAPDPGQPWQRPCCNLDRDPYPFESKTRCMGHILSEQLSGKGKEGAFRPRELLFNDEMIRINSMIEAGGNPMNVLNAVPEMCYLCHLYFLLQASIEQRDRILQRQDEDVDLTNIDKEPQSSVYGQDNDDDDDDDDKVLILNKFMVITDQVGEYNRNAMIPGDQTLLGLFGAVPAFNRDNYIYTDRFPIQTKNGRPVPGFLESDALLFRLARVPSDQIESSQRIGSIRSTLTKSGSRPTHYQQ